jgi:hypothetical protein
VYGDITLIGIPITHGHARLRPQLAFDLRLRTDDEAAALGFAERGSRNRDVARGEIGDDAREEVVMRFLRR